MPASTLASLLAAVKGKLHQVVDVPAPAESDVEQLRSAVLAALSAGKDSTAERAQPDLQDVLHIASTLWVRSSMQTAHSEPVEVQVFPLCHKAI